MLRYILLITLGGDSPYSSAAPFPVLGSGEVASFTEIPSNDVSM